MNKAALAAITIGIGGACHPAFAYDYWQTYCGTSKNDMQACIFRKGDAVLNGRKGYTHTYIMPNGNKYQWFVPVTNTLCRYSDNFLKSPDRSWFLVNPQCSSDGFTSFQGPSGDYAFYIWMN